MTRIMTRTCTWGRGSIRPVLLLIMLLPLSSCASLEQIIKQPEVTFSHFNLTDASLLEGTAVFHFNVHNPNPIGIRASRITYDLKLNQKDFVAGQLNQGVSLAAGATSPMRIPIRLNYLDFFDSLNQLWQNKSADYALSGGFSVGPLTIPYKAKGSFDLPRLPKITLETLEITRLSLSGASLNCRLKMHNPNDFDVIFKQLDYHLKLGGTAFAQASARPQGPIGGNDRSVMNLGFDVSFAQLGRSAYQLLMGRKAQYTLDGGLVFDTPGGGQRSVPFSLSGLVPFER